MSRLALVSALLLAAAAPALANGRPPGTSTINFRKLHNTDVLAGMTFGAVISHDAGATWYWFCEDAIGYGGMYDPDYAFTSSNKIFATTFNGLKVNTNGCTFDDTPPPIKGEFVSSDELGPDGALYVGTADSMDSNIYKSTDDGATFPAMTMPGMINDWWESIAVSPSDAKRVYLTGYRFVDAPGDAGGSIKVFLLFTSTDGGATWAPMQLDTIATNPNSAISIAGIEKTTPTTVYARVTVPDGIVGDAVYRSEDAGQHWTKILEKGDSLGAFAARANGDLVAGTPTLGAFVSHDKGASWTALVNPPHLGCLVENDAGELWGCTQNYGSNQVPGDNYGIMKTTDLATWTGVLRYQDIKAPVDCAPGTAQYDKCTKINWCVVKQQLGITSTVIDCATHTSDLPLEAMTPGTGTKKGCCSTGQDAAPGAMLLSVAIGFVTLRRRRR